MKLLSIITCDDGRTLKRICQGLIKSGACQRILVSNYIHSYEANHTKGLQKTQHKLIQIHFEEPGTLTTMLDKLLPNWQKDHRIHETISRPIHQ